MSYCASRTVAVLSFSGLLIPLLGIGAESPRVPQAILAWPTGPLEVRVAMADSVELAEAERLVGQSIRFEGSDPYRETLGIPTSDGNFGLGIAGVRVEDEGRTVVMATDPHPRATTYHVPDLSVEDEVPGASYTLGGVEAQWYEEGAEADVDTPAWSGWWPRLEPDKVQAATEGSVPHERGFERINSGSGTLVLRTLVRQDTDAQEMTVRLEGDRPFEAFLGFEMIASEPENAGSHRAVLKTETFPGEPAELRIMMPLDGRSGEVLPRVVAWRVRDEDGPGTDTTLEPSNLQLSWAPLTAPPVQTIPQPPFSLEGGDPARGAEVFASALAKCSTCHQIGGQGGEVGPSLDKLVGADPARIYRDIADPSALIAPEYVTYTVALNDGRVAVGVVRAEGTDTLRVLDTDAKVTSVLRAEVADLLPSGTSVMPVGLAGAIGEDRLRDLIAYLRAPK